MAIYFKSDNTAPACPEILDAIAAANAGFASGYGDDHWTRRLERRMAEIFEREVTVYPVATGTAANSLALATLVPPYGAVFAHDEAHILRDECGAVEAASGGARLVSLTGPHAKLTAVNLRAAVEAIVPSVHTVQPRAVSISQLTELGTAYRPGEIAAVAQVARETGLRLHMDGARFANAVAALGCSPAETTWRAGVDALSFGATKNGALAAEAVVFFDPDLVRDFEFRRKRGGHLFSKMRFVSAQLLAYLQDDLWLRNARRANALAARIAAAAPDRLLAPADGNEVFMRLGSAGVRALREHGFVFYDWGAAHSGEARFVVSWNQPEADVDALAAALRRLGPVGDLEP